MSSVLYDAVGPRGKRRIAIGSVVGGALLAALIGLALLRFGQEGQFDSELWSPFVTDPEIWNAIGEALVATLTVAVVSLILSLLLGLVLALGRLSRVRPVRLGFGAWVELFRGLPLLLLILFAALALPQLGLTFSTFTYLVIGLVAYNSAVFAEILRAGILSLPRGQSEAAYAVGLGYRQVMTLVVVPQAVRRMLPTLISQAVTLLKDTSLGFVIGYLELTRRAGGIGQENRNSLQTYLVVAAIYVLLAGSLSRLAVRLESRQARRYGAAPSAQTTGVGTGVGS